MANKKQYRICVLYALLLVYGSEAKTIEKRGVMDNFNDGLKLAGQMFGINTAADVAGLVAKAFSGTATRSKPDLMSIIQQGLRMQAGNDMEHQSIDNEAAGAAYHQEQENAQESPPHESEEQTSKPPPPPPARSPNFEFSTGQMLTNMLRMVGFDATKLGALAINALVMVAQAIGNTLMSATRRLQLPLYDNASTGPEALYETNQHQPRELRSDAPIDWFLQQSNPQTKLLLKEMTDENLSNRVVQMIENLETKIDEGGCLKLLICKSSPFIWGMQKSVKQRLTNETITAAADDDDDDIMNEQQQGTDDGNSYFNTEIFFQHLPSINEFRTHGETCEARFAQSCKRDKLT